MDEVIPTPDELAELARKAKADQQENTLRDALKTLGLWDGTAYHIDGITLSAPTLRTMGVIRALGDPLSRIMIVDEQCQIGPDGKPIPDLDPLALCLVVAAVELTTTWKRDELRGLDLQAQLKRIRERGNEIADSIPADKVVAWVARVLPIIVDMFTPITESAVNKGGGADKFPPLDDSG